MLSVLNDEAVINVCAPRQRGLLTMVVSVLSKHGIDVISVQVGADDAQSFFNIYTRVSTTTLPASCLAHDVGFHCSGSGCSSHVLNSDDNHDRTRGESVGRYPLRRISSSRDVIANKSAISVCGLIRKGRNSPPSGHHTRVTAKITCFPS